jgi:putative Holliday junction resolvase
MSEFPGTGRLAAIDFGTVRMGVAVSNADRTLASPLENYTRRGEQADADFFRRLVHDEGIVGFIVGLPIHTSGLESQKSLQARTFAKWLTDVTACPVRFHDERYTTREADYLLGEAKLTSKQRKQRLDKLAAQLLLTAYLESRQDEQPPAPLDDVR